MRKRKCLCRAGVALPGHLVCWTCWQKLPRRLQDDVARAYRHDRGSKTQRAAIRRAFAWLKEEGRAA